MPQKTNEPVGVAGVERQNLIEGVADKDDSALVCEEHIDPGQEIVDDC